MINLTDKLIAVIVPEDAFKYKTEYEDKYTSLLIKQKSKPDNNPYSETLTYDDWYYHSCLLETSRSKSIPKIKIIGTITKSEEFDFDCEEYVEKHELGYGYKDYDYPNSKAPLDNKEDSFLTLLDSKGIFLEQLNNQKILILEKI